MNNYFKATFAFLAFSFFVCVISVPSSSAVVSFADNSVIEASIVDSSTDEFYINPSSSKNLVESVVKLNFELKTPFGGQHLSSATGFSVAYDKKKNKSYIVTNDHFCEAAYETGIVPGRFYYEPHDTMLSRDDGYNGLELVILDSDPSKDLCLMLADGYVKPTKVAPKSYKVEQAEPVKIIGAPVGIFPIILDSYISGLTSRSILPPHMSHGEPLYLVSEMIFGGHSGSPVFNKKGHVIGVLFLGLSNVDGAIYGSVAIPLGDIHLFLDKNLIKH